MKSHAQLLWFKVSSFTCCLAPVQEVSLAGMLSLLTAVLLQTAPAATPGEASFTALPSNFAAVALGVLRCGARSQPMLATNNQSDLNNCHRLAEASCLMVLQGLSPVAEMGLVRFAVLQLLPLDSDERWALQPVLLSWAMPAGR